MVSANSANCTPAEPSVAGPSARKNCLTSASSSGHRSRVSTSARNASPPTRRTCKHAGNEDAPRRGVTRGRKEGGKRIATISDKLSRMEQQQQQQSVAGH